MLTKWRKKKLQRLVIKGEGVIDKPKNHGKVILVGKWNTEAKYIYKIGKNGGCGDKS